MKEMKAKMNIDFDEMYDEESDIYYVSFKTGEPSCAIELDDVLLIERGIFTGMPTGFRILNFKKNPVEAVGILVKKVKKAMENVQKNVEKEFRTRENQMEQRLEKVLS